MRLTITHVRRWLINRHQVGTGHVYQGRYKSFAMQWVVVRHAKTVGKVDGA